MIEGITNAELTDSLSHNFIVQMIPHHRAAIEMSENLLQYTTFVPLQRIAQNIVNEQTKSIENMDPFRRGPIVWTKKNLRCASCSPQVCERHMKKVFRLFGGGS